MPCPPLCDLVTPLFAFVLCWVPVSTSDVCVWVVEGLGWCEGGGGGVLDGVWSPPGALT